MRCPFDVDWVVDSCVLGRSCRRRRLGAESLLRTPRLEDLEGACMHTCVHILTTEESCQTKSVRIWKAWEIKQ